MRRLGAVMLVVGLAMMGVAAVGCKRIPPPTPLAELNDQQLRGHEVFQARCAGCHYDRVSGELHGPSLKGIFKQTYLPSGAPANDDRVIATVEHGRGMMPAVRIDESDLSDLLAYLHTL